MLIDTTLLANDTVIVKGLLDGSLKRFGSVIRFYCHWSDCTSSS